MIRAILKGGSRRAVGTIHRTKAGEHRQPSIFRVGRGVAWTPVSISRVARRRAKLAEIRGDKPRGSIYMTDGSANFGGMQVAAFESRRAEEMARLIERFGGVAHVSP